MPRTPIPTDFAPYRDAIADCWCVLCSEVAYAASDVLDFQGERHLAAAVALLRALQGGTHSRVTLAERAAEARAVKAAKLDALREAGASLAEIAAVERGYVKVRVEL